MKNKSTIRLIISEITAFALIVVPLALWFFEDYTVETIVILYALENVLAMIFAVLCFLILVPSKEIDGRKNLAKSKTIKNFIIVCGTGTLVVFIFPAVFIFLLGQGKGVAPEAIKFGLTIILAFQLFEFFSNLYLLRPLSLKEGEFLISFSFGGIPFLLISMIVGVFLGAFFNISVFLPFIILKTIVDILQPIQFFLGQTPSQTEARFPEITTESKSRFGRR